MMTPEQVISSINSVLRDLEMDKLLLVYHFALGLASGVIEPKKRGRPKNESK
ncbi:MAG: hypothetical protein IJF78_01025 [Clostridia bacterium]|nr:hypothetical protein [Clostridia bacterium]